MGDVRQQRSRQGSPLGRLCDDRVAGCQSRSDAPGGEHERRIPRRDDRRNTGGVIAHAFSVAANLSARMIKFLDEVGEEAEVHSDARHDAAPMRSQQGAVVARFDPGQFLGTRVDAVSYVAQQLSSLTPGHRGPVGEGLLGSPHRGVDLWFRAGRDFGNRLLVDRGDIGKCGFRCDSIAADPVPSVHLHALDRRSGHPRPCLLLEVVRGFDGD